MAGASSKLSPLALGCFGLGNGFGKSTSPKRRQRSTPRSTQAGRHSTQPRATCSRKSDSAACSRAARDRVYLATKAFPCEPYTRENLNAALDGSLRRLNTDHVDLFQLHAPQDWLAPFGPIDPDAVAEALDEIKASGKARDIGVCNLPLSELKELHERTPIFATQNLYSMLDRTGNDTIHLPVEDEILPYSLANGIAVLVGRPSHEGSSQIRYRASELMRQTTSAKDSRASSQESSTTTWHSRSTCAPGAADHGRP